MALVRVGVGGFGVYRRLRSGYLRLCGCELLFGSSDLSLDGFHLGTRVSLLDSLEFGFGLRSAFSILVKRLLGFLHIIIGLLHTGCCLVPGSFCRLRLRLGLLRLGSDGVVRFKRLVICRLRLVALLFCLGLIVAASSFERRESSPSCVPSPTMSSESPFWENTLEPPAVASPVTAKATAGTCSTASSAHSKKQMPL